MQISQTDFIPGTKIQHSINVLITVTDSSGMVKKLHQAVALFCDVKLTHDIEIRLFTKLLATLIDRLNELRFYTHSTQNRSF